jgi:hypothetical protein
VIPEKLQFENLDAFFNLIEFCPLCKSRTLIGASFYSVIVCELGNNVIRLHDYGTKSFSIDLHNNTVSQEYKQSLYGQNMQLVVSRQCSKYHFFYNGICNISKSNLTIDNLIFDKYHFIRRLNNGKTHITINGSITSDTTSIRITADYKTNEITLPLMDFDLSNKKKLDAKLKKILLLI